MIEVNTIAYFIAFISSIPSLGVGAGENQLSPAVENLCLQMPELLVFKPKFVIYPIAIGSDNIGDDDFGRQIAGMHFYIDGIACNIPQGIRNA